MKWLSFLFAACLAMGCTSVGTSLTPEQKVARSNPRNAKQFQLLAEGVTPDGEVAIVYSYRVPTPAEPWPEDYFLGFKILKREGRGD